MGGDANRSLLDDVVDLEERFEEPGPEIIAGRLTQFGRVLKEVVLPFLGVNALLIGSIVYRKSSSGQLAELACVALLAIVWVPLVLSRARRPGWIDLGGFASVLLMAFLSVGGAWLAICLGLASTAALAIAVCARHMPEKSSIVYVAYLPWMAMVALPQTTFRVGFEFVSLVPMAALFLFRGLRLAGAATLTAAAVAGFLEFDRIGSGNPYLIILIFACFILGIWYESHQVTGEQSSLRQFVGQGLIVALAWTAVSVSVADSASAWWVWASGIALYELVQAWRERFARPTRAGWVAISIVLCLATQFQWAQADWYIPALGTLAVATGLHLLAKRLQTRFLSNLALALGVGAAAEILSESKPHFEPSVIVSGVLAYTLLMTIAFTPVARPTIPWFQGVLQQSRVDWIRRAALVLLAQLLRLPILGAVFHWIRLIFRWLKYVISGEKEVSFSTVIFAAAQAFAALTIGNQVMTLMHPAPTPAQELPVYAAVWIPWGVCIALRGRARHSLVYPILGIIFVAVPVAVQFTSAHSNDDGTRALVLAMIGLGVWVIGAVAGVAPAEKAETPRV
jgi:hypothetical protein